MSDLFDGLVIGLHLVSAHSTPGMNDSTPGLYLRTDSGFTAGAFENSLSGTHKLGNDGRRRTSTYVGWTFETPGRQFGLTVGAVNGYGRDAQWSCTTPQQAGVSPRSKGRTPPSLPAPPAPAPDQPTDDAQCTDVRVRPAIRPTLPLAVLSGRLPLSTEWSARFGYVYVPAAIAASHMHVGNLMLERRF